MPDNFVPQRVTIELTPSEALVTLLALGDFTIEGIVTNNIPSEDLPMWHSLIEKWLHAVNCPEKNPETFLQNFIFFVNVIHSMTREGNNNTSN